MQPTTLVVAGVQMDVEIGRPHVNLQRIIAAIGEARRAHGARLVVFPECALTGYCYDSLEEARPHAEPLPGPGVEQVAAACRRHDVHVIYGTLEADGDRLFNACALVGPQGLAGSYRKIHLPHLGVDRFVAPGDRPFRVDDIGTVRVGMHICYDGSFPESARVMALDGADLLVLPTNWPPAGECMATSVINARAMENVVYSMAVNRVGSERGFEFIGKSRICAPDGSTIAEAAHDREAIIAAEIDPAVARRKRLVRVPGKHVIDRFHDRRPEMYGRIVQGAITRGSPALHPRDRNPPQDAAAAGPRQR